MLPISVQLILQILFKMNNDYRFILEPYNGKNTRYTCPECGVLSNFTRYIDKITGKHVHPSVGRCNREDKCGYHYKPKQYYLDNNVSRDRAPGIKAVKEPPKIKEISFVPSSIVEDSRKAFNNNYFVRWLYKIFPQDVVVELIEKYNIGTSKLWQGAVVFWQKDINHQVRTGKIMLYDINTGQRVKKPHSLISWSHKYINMPDFKLRQCLFGEHLINYLNKPVAIVEGEKTAIIASAYFPQFNWVATGGKNNAKLEKYMCIRGKNVILFPDLGAFNKWSEWAKEISHNLPGTQVKVSDLLERNANQTDKEQGLDLADYLVRFEYKYYQSQAINDKAQEQQKSVVTEHLITANSCEKGAKSEAPKRTYFQKDFPELTPKGKVPSQKPLPDWEIEELETFFSETELPSGPIIIDCCSTINDVNKFVTGHLMVIKSNKEKERFFPYYMRLVELKKEIMKTRKIGC